MTMPTHPVDRRLWFVSLAIIVAMVAVGIIVSGPQPHVGSALAVRLAAATAVVGVLIAVVVLTRPA